MMTIGQRIKERRKELKLSADELAARLGKDRSTIYRYEKGDIENLPLDILEPIAEALDMKPYQLMGWNPMSEKEQKNSDAVIDITNKLLSDGEFFAVVNSLYNLSPDQLRRAVGLLDLFFKESLNEVKD